MGELYRSYDSDPKCKRFVDTLRSYHANIRRAYIVGNSCVVDFEHPRLSSVLKKHPDVLPGWYISSAELDLSEDEVHFNINTPTDDKNVLEVYLPPSDTGYRIHLFNEEPRRLGVQGSVRLDRFTDILETMLLDP